MTAQATKERPIIFTGESVLAILDGRKTMTRRIVKPQPQQRESDGLWLMSVGRGKWASNERMEQTFEGKTLLTQKTHIVPFDEWMLSFCPYHVGQRLWVKEAWSPDHRHFYPHFPIVYKADATILSSDIENGKVYSPEAKAWFPFRWRSPLFMPRWVSRITLEVPDVKLERVDQISEADARYEGAPYEVRDGFAKAWFAGTWSKINGKGSWEQSPWVWAVTFRTVSPGATESGM